jgi:hypothetical protein
MEVILRLACFRYLSRSAIRAFLFEGSALKPHSMEVQVGRILGRLKAAGLVASTQRLVGGPGGGSGRLAYFLSRRGQKLADAFTGGPPRRPPQNGSFLMRHGQMSAEVALAFRKAARTHPGHELTEWECDWAAALKLGSGLVVPDARIVYHTRHWEFSAFIEVDLATEGTRFFARKIGRYLDLCLNGSWRKELSRWPLVLTVAPTMARADALKAATEPLLRRPYYAARLARTAEFFFTSLGALCGPCSPLGPIWRVAGREGLHPLVTGLDVRGFEIDGPDNGVPTSPSVALPATFEIRTPAESRRQVLRLDPPAARPAVMEGYGHSNLSNRTRGT